MAGEACDDRITHVFIDLDDTMYFNPVIPTLVRGNIQDYMKQHLGVPAAEVERLCSDLHSKHGTTLAGLVATGYDIDVNHWHQTVEGTLDYGTLILRDPELRNILRRIPLPKYVFTNADMKHTEKCLNNLGVADCFEGIVCFDSLQQLARQKGLVDKPKIICKPSQLAELRQAFELGLEQVGAEPSTSIFVDDSPRNVVGAQAAGLLSILVGRSEAPPGVGLAIPRIHDLPKVVPKLFESRIEDPDPGVLPSSPCAIALMAPSSS